MKTIYLHILFLFFLLLTACTDKEVVSTSIPQAGNGYQFTVSIPVPIEAGTRSLGSSLTKDYVESLPMNVLVFDEHGFFVAFATAKEITYDEGSRQGTYTIELPNSDQKRILHFVLGNVTFDTYTPADSETSIFSQLTVGDETDVYWQRVVVERIVKDENGNSIIPPLTNEGYVVSLIRNFTQISVDVSTGIGSELTLLGFTVINNINRGTVAPFIGNEDNLFASFEFGEEGEGTDYEKFVALNPGFGGCNPPRDEGALEGTIPPADNNDSYFTSPAESKYVYERNQDEAQSPAYVLVKAIYNDEEGEHLCYYKIDIVSFNKETFVAPYLNLYRNFHYQIHINSVKGVGYDTPQEAAEAVASNNISSSVEVSQVNQIEDGLGNSLYVENLNIMIVSLESCVLDYNYIHNGNQQNGEDYVKITPVNGYNHNAVQSITSDGNGHITIVPVATLPDVIETQEFIVAGASGLSRRVTVRVRKKFEFDVVDCDNVEKGIGKELTLVVRLPDNMPTAVFPLTLDIESEKKSIYPEVSKNRIPVTSKENHTFSYQATVTHEDYQRNSTFFFHFKTNMEESATTIHVTNDYFVDDKASFENTAKMYNFLNLKLVGNDFNLEYNEDEDEYIIPDFQSQGKKVTLQFELHKENDGYTPTGDHIVEIFADYFDLEHATSNTGDIAVREDGQCILYTPKEVYGTHSITFEITKNLASETIQLSSLDHNTATLDYSTSTEMNVTLNYTYNRETSSVPNGTQVTVYQDMNGNGEYDNRQDSEVDSGNISGNSGSLTFDLSEGLDESDVLIFRCRVQTGTSYWGPQYSYFSESKSIGELLNDPSLTLVEER